MSGRVEHGRADGTQLRDATDADLPSIREIFNHWIETSTASFRTTHDIEQNGPDCGFYRSDWVRRDHCHRFVRLRGARKLP